MKPLEVYKHVKGHPWMTLTEGRLLYDLLIDNERKSVLELGTFHGVGTCYIAGAMEETGGLVQTCDLVINRDPAPVDLLRKCSLNSFAVINRDPMSYTWTMQKMIESGYRFDFVYIDGGHTWDVTGFAFFLADQLLTSGGMILFDDLNWTIGGSPSLDQELPLDRHKEPQVKKVWELLAKKNRSYVKFEILNGGKWGLAHRKVEPYASRC